MTKREMNPDIPPITFVTTSTAGNSDRRAPMNPPTILTKPAKMESSSHVLVKRPNDHYHNGPNSTRIISPNHSASEINDMDVDSALLAALRDKRERMALLRLEQNLIDFMNDQTCTHMEVGGPLNSIVIRGSATTGGNSSDSNNLEATGAAGQASSPMGAARNQSSINGHMMNSNENGGGRQTSFQRKCLHKLADRFNIVREQQIFNPSNNHYNYANNPNLIRIHKVKESRIPTLKLINLDLTKYEQPTTPQDRGDGPSVMGITDRLAGTRLQDGGQGVADNGAAGKKKKKVKIMKRSSNSNAANDRNEKNKSNANRRKGKKFSDKEKEYAEARARIFNTTADSPGPSPNHLEESDHVIPLVDSHDVESAPNSTNPSATNSPSSKKSISPLPSQDDVSLAVRGVVDGTGGRKRNSIPAAATGGGASKVTWRNREQEASDPDFQRAHHPIMVPSMRVPVGSAPSVNPQYLHQQYGPPMVNGHGHLTHAHGVAGYHYPGAVDGRGSGGPPPMYNPAAAGHNNIYAPANQFHADPSASWQRQDASQNSYPVAYGRSRNHPPPSQNHEQQIQQQMVTRREEATVGRAGRKIDLSQDEFPALG